MKISSFDREVRTLLESGYYKIPRFQRPYSWLKENVEEFWKDSIENLETEYFIGSMVVFKEKDNYYGIVDGQQRLTTITIMLAVVRDNFKKYRFNDLANGVQGRIERKNVDNVEEFVVQTETSYPYFQEYIQKGTLSSETIDPGSEELNLKTAYETCSTLLDEKINLLDGENQKKTTDLLEAELKKSEIKSLN